MRKPCDHTRGGSLADGTPICIKCGEVLPPRAPDREPVAQALSYIIRALEIVIEMANDPATYDEVAAEEIALWCIKCRIELLTSDIKEKQDAETKIRLVQ